MYMVQQVDTKRTSKTITEAFGREIHDVAGIPQSGITEHFFRTVGEQIASVKHHTSGKAGKNSLLPGRNAQGQKSQ
jgi:hypothetical protein